MRCVDCRYWGDGDGTGIPYDAGHVNHCNHPKIHGEQHPSYGACGEPTSMVMVEGVTNQHILTRRNFGCILFERRSVKKSK
jgi:hypothetical protein